VSRLAGQVALVTGAASGIGVGISVAFASEGADVVLADLAEPAAAAGVLAAVRDRGRAALYVQADVSDEASVRTMAHYSASKAGIIGLTKALAREVSHRGVLVNAIAPGPIVTPLLDGETEEWRAAKLAELPMRRFGRVDEVTPTAVMLASADGSYYAGQTLGPNGGDVML
jgi:NAD(P)-dependent dehydrogenase (short-subunit alcohol dehydrogenase family)